jgi:hypothetical protein
MSLLSKASFQLEGTLRWLGRVTADRFRKIDAPIHIFFCTTDHYEPGSGGVSADRERAIVDELLTVYPKMADAHRDHDNCVPRRSWFFPPHYHRYGTLPKLVSLCARGYGEIELHLHHGKTAPDTEANLRETIQQTIREYSCYGIFGKEDGQTRYGFIHGDWALANSRDNQFCGVNSEITVLQETGCYADFTFPAISLPATTPRKINSIYYARGDASHREGPDVRRGGRPEGGLMIVEGCQHPYFLEDRLSGLRLVGDALAPDRVGLSFKRIDLWVKTGIHVRGKRNWVFIKTHTHGATDAALVNERPMDEAFGYMERMYNDGDQYVLHYVTARELYNIIKAIEHGEPGEDPHAFRNYKIAPPQYNTSHADGEASDYLRGLVAKTYQG